MAGCQYIGFSRCQWYPSDGLLASPVEPPHMYDDVLVPTDGSEAVAETLDHALPIASSNEATVHSLYVVDNRIVRAADEDTQDEIRTTLEDEGREAVAAVADAAVDAGLDAVEELQTGTPWKVILEYAQEADIDLVVIGSHGKSPMEKITSMGSVSERVVDNADVPVFVVRKSE